MNSINIKNDITGKVVKLFSPMTWSQENNNVPSNREIAETYISADALLRLF